MYLGRVCRPNTKEQGNGIQGRKLFVANSRQWPEYVGLQVYDIKTGTWAKAVDGLFGMSGRIMNGVIPTLCMQLAGMSVVQSWQSQGMVKTSLSIGCPSPSQTLTTLMQVEEKIRRISSYSTLAFIHGIWYEIPNFYRAPSNKGMMNALILTPISRSLWNVFDFCFFNGMFAVGRSESFPLEYHTGQSQSGLDLIALEDLWKFGSPRGYGGVWKNTRVSENETSNPFLIYWFDKKTLWLQTNTDGTFTIEVDPIGDGSWVEYDTVELEAGTGTLYALNIDAV